MGGKYIDRANRSRIIGRLLLEAREALGAAQDDVEEAAGISRGYLSTVERGKRQPSVEVFVALCKALKIDPGTLIRKIAAAIN